MHWAELTFLDLVEHLASSLDGPALIVCAARHELADVRPEWPSVTRVSGWNRYRRRTARLVVADLLDGAELAADVSARIAGSAAGNPLFVRQLLSMLIDDGRVRRDNGAWVAGHRSPELEVPPTIHALLAARLDLLRARSGP